MAVFALVGSVAQRAVTVAAGTITSEAPHDISGTADVSTWGYSVAAYAMGQSGAGSTFVNGVAFQNFTFPRDSLTAAAGMFSFQSISSQLEPGFINQPQSPPFTTLPSTYQSLLGSYLFTRVPFLEGGGLQGGGCLVAISGLVVGMQYQLEWWTNTSEGVTQYSRLHSATAGNAVILSDDPSRQNGGLGQYEVRERGRSLTSSYPASSLQLTCVRRHAASKISDRTLVGGWRGSLERSRPKGVWGKEVSGWVRPCRLDGF